MRKRYASTAAVSVRSFAAYGFVAAMLVSFAASAQAGTTQQKPFAKQLRQATQTFTAFGFQKAAEQYAAIADQAKVGSPAWQQAVFGEALADWHQTPPTLSGVQQATKLLKKLLKKSPDSKYAPDATLDLGRIAELSDLPDDPVRLKPAQKWYRKVLKRWPKREISDEAMLRLAGTYTQQFANPKKVKHGVAMLNHWLKHRPHNSLASIMWEQLAWVYQMQLHNNAKALDCYLKADAIGLVEPERAGMIYWRICVLAERVHRLHVAVKYYRNIVIEAPRSGRAYGAQMALKRLAKAHPTWNIKIPPLHLYQKTGNSITLHTESNS